MKVKIYEVKVVFKNGDYDVNYFASKDLVINYLGLIEDDIDLVVINKWR